LFAWALGIVVELVSKDVDVIVESVKVGTDIDGGNVS